MPSIIESYTYDIFISYRQKDNKHDGWVSEFVENLKGELESTFKEEISVYFDINPHDGLLETHDVDESLKDKLKCLVFIPIISRTYCDPKSFAWEHEFKAFVEQASKDKFGLKVKLPNGNVASRVLPVQIHDLDNEDIIQCESVLGSVLRGIEFIYKEAGVDKPLAPDDDEKKNLNNTKYKIQIVKVAHAIKEIISSIQQHKQGPDELSAKTTEPILETRKNNKTRIIAGSVIALALIIIGILFIPRLFKPSEELEKSIAVLPFRNDSPNQEMYFINGVMEEILDNLCKIEDIRVVSRSSVEQYRAEPKPIPVVAEEMDVSYVLEGSGQRDGDNIRLTVQLLDAKKDQHMWSESFYREIKNIFSLQSEIAQAIASELKAIITPEEKQLIEKIPTLDLTAYDYYQRGNAEINMVPPMLAYGAPASSKVLDRAEYLFRKALECDSTFALAYTGLANVYYGKNYSKEYLSENFMDTVIVLVNKALSYDNQLPEAHLIRGSCYFEKGDPDKAVQEYNKVLQYNPNNWLAYYLKGYTYFAYDPVKGFENLFEAIKRNHGPELPEILKWISFQFISSGFYEPAYQYAHDALNLDGDSVNYLFYLSTAISITQNDFQKSLDLLKQAYQINSTNLLILAFLGQVESFISQNKESLRYYKKLYDVTIPSGQMPFSELHRIGYAYLQNGYREEAEYFFDKHIEYKTAEIKLGRPRGTKSLSYMSYYDLAAVYACKGEKERAFENLRIFINRSYPKMGMLFYLKNDPLINSLRNDPEFQEIVNDYEIRANREKGKVRKWLEEQGMI